MTRRTSAMRDASREPLVFRVRPVPSASMRHADDAAGEQHVQRSGLPADAGDRLRCRSSPARRARAVVARCRPTRTSCSAVGGRQRHAAHDCAGRIGDANCSDGRAGRHFELAAAPARPACSVTLSLGASTSRPTMRRAVRAPATNASTSASVPIDALHLLDAGHGAELRELAMNCACRPAASSDPGSSAARHQRQELRRAELIFLLAPAAAAKRGLRCAA